MKMKVLIQGSIESEIESESGNCSDQVNFPSESFWESGSKSQLMVKKAKLKVYK